MAKAKTKIVLDADVIIHFAKGGLLSSLPTILSEYEHIILSPVYNEIHYPIKHQLDQQIMFLKNITLIEFKPSSDIMREFALLRRRFGNGESACMAYCKFNHDIIGSSNIKDIKEYCTQNDITYLTTIDFLYYAIQRGKLSVDEAHDFIKTVNANDSKLPNINMATYISTAIV